MVGYRSLQPYHLLRRSNFGFIRYLVTPNSWFAIYIYIHLITNGIYRFRNHNNKKKERCIIIKILDHFDFKWRLPDCQMEDIIISMTCRMGIILVLSMKLMTCSCYSVCVYTYTHIYANKSHPVIQNNKIHGLQRWHVNYLYWLLSCQKDFDRKWMSCCNKRSKTCWSNFLEFNFCHENLSASLNLLFHIWFSI